MRLKCNSSRWQQFKYVFEAATTSSSHFNVKVFFPWWSISLEVGHQTLCDCYLFFSVQIHTLTSVYQDVCIPERKLRVNTFALIWQKNSYDDDEDSDGDVDIGGDDDDDGRKAGDLDATHIWEDSQLHQAINKIRIQHFLIMTVLMIVMMMIVMVMMFVKKMMTMEIFLLITFYGIAGCAPCRCTSIESPRIAFQLIMMWMMMMQKWWWCRGDDDATNDDGDDNIWCRTIH